MSYIAKFYLFPFLTLHKYIVIHDVQYIYFLLIDFFKTKHCLLFFYTQRAGNRERVDIEKITQRITSLSLDLPGVDVDDITKVKIYIIYVI